MKILMVCLGNICRSPLAEGILKSKISDNHVVESAGTIDMHEGNQPDKRSIEVAKKHGIDISSQKSKHIQSSDLDNYDLVFCMDKNNLKDVKSLATNEKQIQKISLVLDNSEVPDPYWGKADDFEDVFQLLDKACDEIVKNLKQ
ncbi:low molecular weight protein-tyrosine-phosphatase [Halpernia frigidisoli]|uniref:protein-tyrosine-phosphatase n=1 Tax=Halpernia frigidisoli TaxID=1125876 RepID=A0A1I3F6R1_9FLAO|nr:low molecular weight protein-tyrosine-phosphatase [Halpernia frigidisoli]SFI06882.1 protein-tyrosine phosphatase [Halpernia frigidisoli]